MRTLGAFQGESYPTETDEGRETPRDASSLPSERSVKRCGARSNLYANNILCHNVLMRKQDGFGCNQGNIGPIKTSVGTGVLIFFLYLLALLLALSGVSPAD